MERPDNWGSSPNSVSALEYCYTVLRANREAGLMIDPTHVSTIQSKLLAETKLPRLRVLQLLNKIADAVNTGSNVIELSIDDARVFLAAAKEFT